MTDNPQSSHKEELRRYGFGTDTMKQIKICTICGAPSPASQKSCAECGARLPEHTLYQTYLRRSRYCPKCKTVVPADAAYCPNCGRNLE